MVKGLKVSYLACECVFQRQKHNAKQGSHELNFEGFKMQK